MDNQRQCRTIADQNFFTKVSFFSEGKKCISGKLFDISSNGFCILIKEIFVEPNINDVGSAIFEKYGNVINIPCIMRWIDSPNSYIRCIGFEASHNLSGTDLGPYIK
jgi:hypothetical protein